MKTGFIGIGNMGSAIAKGYLRRYPQEKGNIIVYDADGEKAAKFCRETGTTAAESIKELTRRSRIIFPAVKPDVFCRVLSEMAEAYEPDKVVVSMAAGISIKFIEGFFSDKPKVVRIMPNTPALIGKGMVGICPNEATEEIDREKVEKILSAVAVVKQVEEEMFHCVIGLSGSSPAYTYMYIDALARCGEDCGMERKEALTFAAQSVLGAAAMVLETGVEPATLRDNVCSKGGTTIEAVNTLTANGFADKVKEGFWAAVKKSKLMEKR